MTPLHRLWQRLPHSLRREALFGAAALLAPRIARPAPAPCMAPLVIAGYFGAQTGLGIAAERLAAVLENTGLRPLRVDLTSSLRQGAAATGAAPPSAIPPGPGTLLVHVNGPMLPWAMLALGRRAVAGKRVIGVWNWERPPCRPTGNAASASRTRFWVASRFTAGAVGGAGRPPVRGGAHAGAGPRPALADPRRPSACRTRPFRRTLACSTPSSSIARKNPLAATRAHQQASATAPTASWC